MRSLSHKYQKQRSLIVAWSAVNELYNEIHLHNAEKTIQVLYYSARSLSRRYAKRTFRMLHLHWIIIYSEYTRLKDILLTSKYQK